MCSKKRNHLGNQNRTWLVNYIQIRLIFGYNWPARLDFPNNFFFSSTSIFILKASDASNIVLLVMYGGIQGAPQLAPPDAESRQSLGQQYVWSQFSSYIYKCMFIKSHVQISDIEMFRKRNILLILYIYIIVYPIYLFHRTWEMIRNNIYVKSIVIRSVVLFQICSGFFNKNRIYS